MNIVKQLLQPHLVIRVQQTIKCLGAPLKTCLTPSKVQRSLTRPHAHLRWNQVCAKGSEKGLDSFGKNAAKSFVTLLEAEVLRFVEFDMTENVFLTVGAVILCQGARGIPIDGFLSAQIAEIWACWKEYTGLFCDFAETVQQKLTKICADFTEKTGCSCALYNSRCS